MSKLFRGRLLDEQLMSAMLNSHQWQLRISDVSYEKRDDVDGGPGHQVKSHEAYRDAIRPFTWFVLINDSSDMCHAPFADRPNKTPSLQTSFLFSFSLLISLIATLASSVGFYFQMYTIIDMNKNTYRYVRENIELDQVMHSNI